MKEELFVDETKDYLIIEYSNGEVERIKKKYISRTKAIEKINNTLETKINLNNDVKQTIIRCYIGEWKNLRNYEIEYIMSDLFGKGWVVTE